MRMNNAEDDIIKVYLIYNKVRITLFTDAIGSLSENDFIMVAKIDKLSGN